jgi:hypothetical protein
MVSVVVPLFIEYFNGVTYKTRISHKDENSNHTHMYDWNIVMVKLSMSSMGKINILYKFQNFNFLLYTFVFLFTGVSECIIMGIPMGIGTGLLFIEYFNGVTYKTRISHKDENSNHTHMWEYYFSKISTV